MERTEEKQPHDVVTSDTENHTQIPVDEAPPDKKYKFMKFRAYNTGMWNGPQRENTEQFNRQDDLHLFDALASQLGLTDYQKERGRRLIDRIDPGELTNQGRSMKAVMFSLCAVLANRDVRDGTMFWPNASDNDERFEAIREKEIDADWRTLISLMMTIDHRVG